MTHQDIPLMMREWLPAKCILLLLTRELSFDVSFILGASFLEIDTDSIKAQSDEKELR